MPERAQPSGHNRWERAAERVLARPYLDPTMARSKRRAHLELLDTWLPALDGRAVLKTDLWEEGVAGDELLFALARRARRACGVDVSRVAVQSAARNAASAGVTAELSCSDMRDLPFADGELDAIVSTSTLDHLDTPERLPALQELRRVLSPDGTLVITCDNADNVGDWLLRLLTALRLVPFPMGPALSVHELRGLLREAGFRDGESAYLQYGPRVVTAGLARVLRALCGRRADRAVEAMLRAMAALGRRSPRRLAAFVAVRATALGEHDPHSNASKMSSGAGTSSGLGPS
jgi:SAM-dependent methyltransferase